MKKVKAFIIALILFLVSTIVINSMIESKINANINKILYDNQDKRNNDYLAMTKLVELGIPVFGSSELTSSDNIGYPPSLFNAGNSNFNMILYGRGHIQSFLHTINLGAIESKILDRKVVLILSPQWFEQKYTSQAFPSRFYERMYVEFLKNPKISNSTKKKISDRTLELMETDKKKQENLRFINDILLNNNLNPLKKLTFIIYDQFMNAKSNFMYSMNMGIAKADNPEVKAEAIDFNELRIKAEGVGKLESSNNDLAIYNEYYNTYVKEKYENRTSAGMNSKGNMDPKINGTEEYEDLQLFLDVCKETGIKPLIVNIPVHGKWYDWIGFHKSERESYYTKIREICSQNNVELADFSDKEYEDYFLKDIMHLGWKGWVYLDEAVYRFSKE